jgi:hypothetical protein
MIASLEIGPVRSRMRHVVGSAEVLRRDQRVDLGRGDTRMPEQFLDDFARRLLQQGVAKECRRSWGDGAPNAAARACSASRRAHDWRVSGRRAYSGTAPRERADASAGRGPQIRADRVSRHAADRQRRALAPSQARGRRPPEVDIIHIEPRQFRHAKPGSVQELEDRSVPHRG